MGKWGWGQAGSGGLSPPGAQVPQLPPTARPRQARGRLASGVGTGAKPCKSIGSPVAWQRGLAYVTKAAPLSLIYTAGIIAPLP